MTVVRGLRGFGKTTQVAAWVERQDPAAVTAVWVTASPMSCDAQSFEDRLSDSLSTAGVLVPMPANLPRNGLEELSSALLAASPERRFVLVIDDFHNVRDEQVLEELVGLVERNRHFHLCVCCQGHHRLESLAKARVGLNVIDTRELRFDVAEVTELARTMSVALGPSEAAHLRDAFGGCVAMTRLVLESGQGLTARPAAVEEYIRAELLSDLGDQSLREHLMRFSLVEPVCWGIFRDLCDDPDPGRLLDDLEATGLVERTVGGEEILFFMPAPIREILRDEFKVTLADRVGAFHRRLASWYSEHGEGRFLPVAFHHAVEGRDWALMDRLWSEGLVPIIVGDAALLRSSLFAIPPEVLATRPSMQVLKEISDVASGDTDADGRRATLRAFADACTRLVTQQWDSMPMSELLILATGYLIELRLLGRLEESVAFSDRVSARVNALAATEPDNKGRLAWFYLHRGLTFSLSSDSVRALRAYRLSWEYATGSAVDFVRSQAAANMALTYALAGDAPQAEEWLARHRGFDTARWPGNFVVSIGGHLAAGLLALDRLDLDEVRAELSHLGDGSAALELWPFIAYLYAQHALHTGRAPEALAHLDRVQASNDEGSPADKAAARTLISRARIDLLVACGRGERAKRLIQTAGARRFSIRVPALRLRLLSGLDVIPELDPLTWDAATPVRDRVEMLLLGAVATLRQDDQRNARHFMHQALDLYSETGILRPFATIAVAEVEKLLELTGREMAPGDMAALARQPSVYPARLVFVELSEHEQAVLEALAATGSRQAIADSLFVSVNTVKTQLASIYHKLGSSSREEALARATEHELLQRASGAE